MSFCNSLKAPLHPPLHATASVLFELLLELVLLKFSLESLLVLCSLEPGGSVIIIIIIRTGSQMENKLHENVSKKIRRSKEHTG